MRDIEGLKQLPFHRGNKLGFCSTFRIKCSTCPSEGKFQIEGTFKTWLRLLKYKGTYDITTMLLISFKLQRI